MRRAFALLVIAGALAGTACGGEAAPEAPPPAATLSPAPPSPLETSPAPVEPFTLESPAFGEGASIPERFTCDGADLSPPLRWSGAPAGAVELALIVDDPDAPGGTFTHWTLWRIDPALGSIEEGAVPAGARQGRTDFDRTGYGGPCPPEGDSPHRYLFTLHALSSALPLADGAPVGEVRREVERLSIASTRLTATFGR